MTLMELDSDTRRPLFHHLKLEIERKAKDKCQAFAAFEKTRFEAKNREYLVTVKGHCINCGLYTPCAFQLYGYMHIYEAYPN
jgi:hypothetical protein